MCELKPLVLFIIFSNHYIYINLLKYINVTTLTTYELSRHSVPFPFSFPTFRSLPFSVIKYGNGNGWGVFSSVPVRFHPYTCHATSTLSCHLSVSSCHVNHLATSLTWQHIFLWGSGFLLLKSNKELVLNFKFYLSRF